MFNLMGRTTLSLTVVANLFLGSFFIGSQAEAAARSCQATFARMETEAADAQGFYLTKIKGSERLTLKPDVQAKMKALFDRNGQELLTNKLVQIIEGAAEFIRGTNHDPSIVKSDKMAKISREMQEILKPSFTKKQYMLANYLMAEAVLRLETMKLSEFKDEELPIFAQPNVLPMSKFNKYAESYIDGTALYADLAGGGGVLAWPTIRSLYANNNWIIAIKNHDMYHLHYAYGHPYYLAVNIQSSRTINDRRYYMISALWESVDTFQSGFESKIAAYYKRRNMSPQEGMLDLATAPEAQITAMEAELGKVSDDYSFNELAYSHGWRPNKSAQGHAAGPVTEKTYLSEIENYINSSLANISKAANKKYVNYSRSGPGRSVEVDQDHIAGY